MTVTSAPSSPSSSTRRPILRTELPGPRAKALVERDERVLSSSYTRVYPLVTERAEGAWVEDVDGNVFLDFTSGVAVTATGHSHPRVVKAIQDQAERFVHMSGTDFHYEVEIRLAERLARIAPVGPDARVFLGNSGTEVIEGAMKLARWVTRRPNYLAFLGGFHGRTFGALSLTASKAIQHERFHPLLPGVYHVPFPSASRGGRDTDETFRAIEAIFGSTADPQSFAAVVVEPIQGEGGYIVPPDDFLPRLRRLTEKHGILLIADEVQSGIGRTGRMFAIEHWGVLADIVAISKGVASGLPLGAFVAPSSLMSWPPGAHGNTFGGNPIACAAAIATLDLVEGGLMKNAADVGAWLLEALREVQRRHSDVVVDVRGKGLMLAIELATREQSHALVDSAFRHGLLTLPAGHSAVRICPPLIIDRSEAELAVELLELAFADI